MNEKTKSRRFSVAEEHGEWRMLAIATAASALAAYWTHKKFAKTGLKVERLVDLQQDAVIALKTLSPDDQDAAAEKAAQIAKANLTTWGGEER
jgi:hypothetical protein